MSVKTSSKIEVFLDVPSGK